MVDAEKFDFRFWEHIANAMGGKTDLETLKVDIKINWRDGSTWHGRRACIEEWVAAGVHAFCSGAMHSHVSLENLIRIMESGRTFQA